MILVADSGSSKTDWMGYTENKTISFCTQGINPYFLNAHDIHKILSKHKEFLPYAQLVTEVYFFGAGCSSPDKHEIVSNGLASFFTKAYISVDHDLMASAFATCRDQAGLVCILGTGSNICLYDGENVKTGNHGLGFVLGDEGSGTYFGKKILLSFLNQTMPKDLCALFAAEFKIDKETVITNTYQNPFPNSYLAGFSRFMIRHKQHPFIQVTLADGFQEFIDTNIKDYKEYKNLVCHFVGSIAFYYQLELKAVCLKNQIKVGNVIQKPIANLYQYILKKEGISV